MVADRIVDLQTAIGVPLTQKDLVPAFVVSSLLRYDIQIFRINFNKTYKNDVLAFLTRKKIRKDPFFRSYQLLFRELHKFWSETNPTGF